MPFSAYLVDLEMRRKCSRHPSPSIPSHKVTVHDTHLGITHEFSVPEDLQDILMKLRDDYQYCLFCGCRYESMEALSSDCPGINEDDH